MLQLCFVLCGHKCLVTNGKQTVHVLVNKETHTHVCVCVHVRVCIICLTPYKTELGQIQKKGIPSFLNYDVSSDKRKMILVTKHTAYFFEL